MMEDKIIEIKQKKEFSQLPDSIVRMAAEEAKGDVKIARAILRKYFGVFLTNRVLKLKDKEVLKYHLSTKKRDYDSVYAKISKLVGKVSSIIDLGSGSNGYSIDYIKKYFGEIEYLGIEASGQLVDNINHYFKEEKLERAIVFHEDLFNLERINELVLQGRAPRLVFLFQVIDALENFEKNYSKKLLLEISKVSNFIVVSLPLQSLSKGKKFAVSRNWLVDFLKENFSILGDWDENGERFICISKK